MTREAKASGILGGAVCMVQGLAGGRGGALLAAQTSTGRIPSTRSTALFQLGETEGQAAGRKVFRTFCDGWRPGTWWGFGETQQSPAPFPTPTLTSTGKPPKPYGGALGALGYQGE